MTTYTFEALHHYFDKKVGYTRTVGDQIVTSDKKEAEWLMDSNLVRPLKAETFAYKKDQKKVFICFHGLQKVGGIEVATHSLVQEFPQRVTILTNSMDNVWFMRLSEHANVIVDYDIEGEYEADVVILAQQDCVDWLDHIKDVEKCKVYQQVHADLGYYDKIEVNLHRDYENEPRIDKFLTVSPNAHDSFKRVLGMDSVMLPNVKRPPRKYAPVIGFFSRATPEKNPEGIMRFIERASSFGYKANYIISSDLDSIYVNKHDMLRYLQDMDNVIYMPINEHCMDWLPKVDYLIQLSLGEASCEVVHEALDVGVPVIVSRIPAFEYIKDGVLGWHVSDIPTEEEIKNIFTKIPKITKKVWDEKTDVETWEKVLKGEL